MTQFLNKPLPNAPEAERAITGGVMLDNALIAQAAETLKAENFFTPFCRLVFDAELKLFEKGERIDPISIGEKIKLSGVNIESYGGVAAITNLTYGLPAFSDLSDYVSLVKSKAKMRELLKTCEAISSTILDEQDETERILSFAQSTINEVCAEAERKTFESVGSLSIKSLNEKVELRKNEVAFTGLQTGFSAIDILTNGLQKSELMILAARPGMGKTSILVNIVEGVCRIQPESVVAVFSLEMSKKLLTERMLCSSAEVSSTKYKNGMFNPDEYERLKTSAIEFQDFQIEIDDTPALTPSQIRSKAMMLKAKKKRLDLVVVDFLQKMSPSKIKENTRLEIGSIARELKDMAKVLDVPVMAISSLNRDCEKRNPPKPMMSDLSESNIIESEADIIAFLYRAHYYNKDANPRHAEMVFEKNRNGETATRDLSWFGEFTKFKD